MSAPYPPHPAQFDRQQAVRIALDRGLYSVNQLGGDLADHAHRIRAILWSPPRVVIVGRLKAGKSTLVNALIGAPVAETAALEATNVVTVYQAGAPSRAELVGLDGTRRPVPLEAGRTVSLGAEAADIAYVHRHLPSLSLENLTLVDTPGLATLTVENEHRTRAALIDGFAQTRSASVDADGAVFLFDSAPRADEMDFLRQLGFTPLNTLGVLSRADSFGEGALGGRNPIEHAHAHAQKLAQALASTVSTVVPVAGLLAESTYTGQVTEADAIALHTVASMDTLELMDLLESENPQHLGPVMRDRLLDLLGEYGVLGGRAVAGRGAHALNRWLIEHSGIAEVKYLLDSAVQDFAAVHRADRILAELDTLAAAHPARQQIRTITDWVRSDPAMQPVLLYRALRAMLLADPHAPVVAELTRMLAGRTDAERLGVHPGSTPEQIAGHAGERLTQVQRRAMSTATAAEDAALAELVRTYTSMRRQP
ncbi:GTPase [Rhodococcus sp. ARC_M6]|uniref:GTPase n=1 Tax=Rhodococcus sp. ARC_M6 TaxID=2928852 RepID=UPI001FB3DAFB|nr:GTPase [Rhodococcus sp. ARC_M6]MCJ0907114.1 50S ribosome-binding GTPase [Rhodococcus sp. ARC_M6]